jgi:hypothetical protein
MKKIKLLLVTLMVPFCTFAWHGNGHMTAGAIAYYYLKAHNPAALQKVLATLKRHPWYGQRHWNDTLAMLPANQQDVGLFMLASTYPDDAKQIHGSIDGNPIHHKWHYVDYPFVPVGQNIQPLPLPTPNAQQKIDELLTVIPGERDSPQKAVDVAWFFHLIEDIHQPLHAASMFNTNNPTGDGGGNNIYIRVNMGAKQVLHSYWDDLVKGTLPQYAGNAQLLLANPAYKESNLPELTTNLIPDDWITKESFVLAKTVAYSNGAVNGTRAVPTNVTAAYNTTAKALGERRVVLAGIRLAKLLAKLYA